jgi:hypothetical protein
MRPPLKLSGIDQEHLQELYNEAGVARDDLPYSTAFDGLCQGFQDRTFKNAHPEQVFSALLKYVRSGTHSAGERATAAVTEEQLKLLKGMLPRHTKGGRLIPYSDEFEAAQREFNKLVGMELTAGDFWRAVIQAQGPKRRPPKRAKVAAAPAEDNDENGE